MIKPTLLLSFLVMITGCETRSTETPEPATQQSVTLEPVTPIYQAEQDFEPSSGTSTELTLVYIGANGCGPCHDLTFKNNMENLKVMLRNRSTEQNIEYSVIGIANDWEVQKGWDFLNSSGNFDEVIIGKNWHNTGAIEFIWNQESLEPAMPQVIVFQREISIGQSGIVFGEKDYLAQYTGIYDIQDWIAEGAIF